MMVTLAIVLLLMSGIVRVFGLVSTFTAESRSVMEMADRVRQTRNRLQQDLAAATAITLPPLDPEQGLGYFEIIEGPTQDYIDPTTVNADTNGNLLDSSNSPTGVNVSVLGDFDDILMFTARAKGMNHFVGRAPGSTTPVQSREAEIIWFATQNPTTGLRTIYRRVLLVLPELGQLSSYNFVDYDISARQDENGNWIANSLSDLTKRENRFAHDPSRFPHAMETNTENLRFPSGNGREGEDVMLGSAAAFDVRVFDPLAPLVVASGTVVGPGDPAWTATTPVGLGAYVDLGYSTSLMPRSHFSDVARPVSNQPDLTSLTYPSLANAQTYCTWSTHYEHDGRDQDGDTDIDEGTNGFDDNGTGGVDDLLEHETGVPYPAPLRGVEVTVRGYEPDSRQVRELTVIQSMMPQ